MVWYVIVAIVGVAAVGASIAYYQVFYFPEIQASQIERETELITSPKQKAIVRIPSGASDPNNKSLDPEVINVVLGVNNTVIWVSEDTVPHSLTTDDEYVDPYSGKFDVRERPPEEGGAFIMPGRSWEFTFTQTGRFSYHGEPHPWMQGAVIVKES
jgi:plastocyanin